jgi:His/Glu/Gln/Arg/opine family amino acid ABC transporter permease subunit
MMQNLIDQFQLNFIDGDRWKLLLSGLGTTLLITFFAVILGIVLGFLVAVVRSAHDTTGKLKILNVIAQIYTTVIRGTPVLVQLMIIYYVVFASVNISKIFVAVLAFGLNSGAYVSEIVRSGIMSVDRGQMEAGRSLGFSYSRTMLYVILPQAFKNVLPTLGNEFITLLKETSVSGYIAVSDLTKAGDIIRSRTFSAFMPLIAVALIYLFFVLIFTKLVSILERRLRESDH